jgi:hypothetical protein
MAHETGEDFDWVGAQAKCSAASMFDRLRTHVEADVRRRNGVLGRKDGWTFEFYDEDDVFEVTRLVAQGPTVEPTVGAVVQFERTGRRIHVHSDDIDVEFTAVVTIDHTGDCKLVVGEALYSDWEIRRMGLELLFFEEVAEEAE